MTKAKKILLTSSALIGSGISVIPLFLVSATTYKKVYETNKTYGIIKNEIDIKNLFSNLSYNKTIENAKAWEYNTRFGNFQNKGFADRFNSDDFRHQLNSSNFNHFKNLDNYNNTTNWITLEYDNSQPLGLQQESTYNAKITDDKLFYDYQEDREDCDPRDPYHCYPIIEPGWDRITLSPLEYRFNYLLKNEFKSLVQKYTKSNNDIEYKLIDGNFDFGSSENFNIKYGRTKKIQNQDLYQEAWVKATEKLRVNFKLKKWNNINVDDVAKLISKFANSLDINHYAHFLEKLNLKENKPLTIASDTMGNLKSSCDSVYAEHGGKSNLEKLKEMLNTLEQTISFNNFEATISYVPYVNDDATSFNLNYKIKKLTYNGQDITNEFKAKIKQEVENHKYEFSNNMVPNDKKEMMRTIYNMFSKLFNEGISLIENIPTVLEPTNIYFNYGEGNFKNRLNIRPGNVLKEKNLYDINKPNSTFRLDNQYEKDVPLRISDPRDATSDPGWGGKWLINSPGYVTFSANLDETEVLMINKQRVDVINRVFAYDLKDLRSSASDEEKVAFVEKDKNKPQDELNDENSHHKNEYVIEILKYKNGSNNTGEPIGKYKIVYVINTQSTKQNFKWYAWDPANNPSQKELITEFEEKDGKQVLDPKTGLPKVNPKYDPAIDPNTGTKKQIVWIPANSLNDEIMKKLRFVYPNLNWLNDFGIFAEASVLGKGALRNIFKDKNLSDDDISYFKVKLYNAKGEWVKKEDSKIIPLSTKNGDSQNAYMSEEGLWLIGATSKKGISNVRLVLISKENKPQNYFYDEIKNKFDEKNIYLQKRFEIFWNSALGKHFMLQLINNENLTEEEVWKLSYEEVWNYYQNWLLKSWADKNNKDIIDEAKDIFNDYLWKQTPNLNGRTKKQLTGIKRIVQEYIDYSVKDNPKLKGIIQNQDWYIEEWKNQALEEEWFNKLATVSIYGSDENKTYEGIALTFRGKGKYLLSTKKIYFRNEAWHIYDPAIDLETLDIAKEFTLNVSKQMFWAKYKTDEQIDADFRKYLKAEVIRLIKEELAKYNKTHVGQEIELDKDIKIANLEEVITQLMRGKALTKGANLVLKGINANLLNLKTINFKNVGDGGKFNLKNLTYLLLNKDNVISETKYENIKKFIIALVKEMADKLSLETNTNYKIYALNIKAYWFELIMKYNDEKLLKDKDLKKAIDEGLEFLKNYKTIEIDGKKIDIEFEPKDPSIRAQLENYKNFLLNEIERDIINHKLNINVFYKMIIIMPNQDTEGFAHSYIINKVNKDYDPSKDPEWKDPDDPKHPDDINPNTKDEKQTNKVVNRWWFILLMIVGGIGAIIGLVFLIRFLSRKYAWTYGKKIKKVNRNSKWYKFKEKIKNIFNRNKNKSKNTIKQKNKTNHDALTKETNETALDNNKTE